MNEPPSLYTTANSELSGTGDGSQRVRLRAARDSEAYGTVEEEGPALDHLREIVARLMGALRELKTDYDAVVAELQDQCAISQCRQQQPFHTEDHGQQQHEIRLLHTPDISAWREEVLAEFVRIRKGYKRQLSRERARADAAEKEARELKELFTPLPGFGEELRAIGSRYLNGDDGCNDSDVVTGIKYYEAAARCGSGQSSLQLGLAYYKGKPAGITRDYEKAFKFFSLAAEGGSSADALYYMGIMLLRGQGTKGDPSRAADCFQRAADAGHVLAQYQLATLYSEGIGVQPDDEKAFALFQNWEQQRAGIRAAAGGFGTTRAAPPTPPSDFMNYTSSSSCAPQPGTSRENFYAPNPLNSPMSCPTAPHACGFTGPLSSLASPGGTGTGGAAASTPVLSPLARRVAPSTTANLAHTSLPQGADHSALQAAAAAIDMRFGGDWVSPSVSLRRGSRKF